MEKSGKSGESNSWLWRRETFFCLEGGHLGKGWQYKLPLSSEYFFDKTLFIAGIESFECYHN